MSCLCLCAAALSCPDHTRPLSHAPCMPRCKPVCAHILDVHAHWGTTMAHTERVSDTRSVSQSVSQAAPHTQHRVAHMPAQADNARSGPRDTHPHALPRKLPLQHRVSRMQQRICDTVHIRRRPLASLPTPHIPLLRATSPSLSLAPPLFFSLLLPVPRLLPPLARCAPPSHPTALSTM